MLFLRHSHEQGMVIARGARAMLSVVALGLLSACAQPLPTTIDDPYEAENRQRHAFNLAVDEQVLRPLSQSLPDGGGPIGEVIGNAGANLGMPAAALNKLLQGKVADAVHNSLRFAINTTLGIGGLFDPASEMGLEPRSTDFGETMHVWGAPEGNYLVVPLLGPSTSRDTIGAAVDLVIDPIGHILPTKEANAARVVRFGSRLGDRARFSTTVDSILYDSADSYAQMRLLYLQSRRFQLGQEIAEDDFIDPYADF